MTSITDIQEKEQAKEIEVPQSELSDFIEERRGDISAAIAARANWTAEQAKWYRWRKGIEGAKPDANKPWKGSSNIHFRLSEKAIRRFKAKGLKSIMSLPRFTRFIHASDSAEKMENYVENKLRGPMGWQDTCTAELDVLAEKGLLITKQTWQTRSEPFTEVCEDSKFLTPLIQAAMAMATNPMTGVVDYSRFSKGRKPMDAVNAVVPKPQQRIIIAGVCGWAYGADEEADEQSLYRRRIESILTQLNDGEDNIAYIDDREVFNDFKVTVMRDPNMVVWSPVNAIDIQDAEMVTHRMRFSQRQMLDKSIRNGGPWKNVETVLKHLSGAEDGSKKTNAPQYPEETQQRTSSDLYQGVQTAAQDDGMVNVWEIHCFVPRKWIGRMKNKVLQDGDTMVRAILTIAADVPGEDGVLRLIEYPAKFRNSKARWCFASHVFNKGAGDLYSGEPITKIGNPFEASFNIAKNSLFDRNTVSISPWILKRADVGITDAQLRAFPSIITVDTPNGDLSGAVQTVPFPNMQWFQSEAAEYSHAMDDLIGSANLSSLEQYPEAPTAEQVQQTVGPSDDITQFELSGYHDFKAKQYRQLYDLLWENYGEDLPPEGDTQPKPDAKGEVVTIKRDDFKPDFVILSGADQWRDNPVLAAQKRMGGIQWLMSDPRLAPFFNIGELVGVAINDAFGPTLGSRISVSLTDAQKNQAMLDNLKWSAQQQMMQEAEQFRKKNSKVKQLANSMPVTGPNIGGSANGGGAQGGVQPGMMMGGMGR